MYREAAHVWQELEGKHKAGGIGVAKCSAAVKHKRAALTTAAALWSAPGSFLLHTRENKCIVLRNTQKQGNRDRFLYRERAKQENSVSWETSAECPNAFPWLWVFQRARRKRERSFNATDLMDVFPGQKFCFDLFLAACDKQWVPLDMEAKGWSMKSASWWQEKELLPSSPQALLVALAHFYLLHPSNRPLKHQETGCSGSGTGGKALGSIRCNHRIIKFGKDL